MCTSDLCNDADYDIHQERAKRLFNNITASNTVGGQQPRRQSPRRAGLLVDLVETSRKNETVVIDEEIWEEASEDSNEVEDDEAIIRKVMMEEKKLRVPRQARGQTQGRSSALTMSFSEVAFPIAVRCKALANLS